MYSEQKQALAAELDVYKRQGMGMDPPQFLKPGDTVRCEIDGIGSLTNTVR